MKGILNITIAIFFVFFSAKGFAQSKPAGIDGNHPYVGVKIAYLKSTLTDCSYQFSPVDFCDKKHLKAINSAIANLKPNFNQHYILITHPEWEKDHQKSVLAIDSTTGVVYPLPIDAYSGILHNGSARGDGRIDFSLNSNKVCIAGAILVYRAFEQGNFCFNFEGDRFVGHHTEYMYTN